jgi:hypothetical protein
MSCCDVNCDCDLWLNSNCNPKSIVHKYCGVETSLVKASVQQMPNDFARPDQGVYGQDRIFTFSRNEADIESGPSAVVTYEGEDWQVYRAVPVTSFCVWQLWARNVALCFSLTEPVFVYGVENCDVACDLDTEAKLEDRCFGRLIVDGGSRGYDNEAIEMQISRSLTIDRWPVGEHPESRHRLKVGGKWYRVLQFTDNGRFVPYTLQVERIDVSC